MSSLPNCPKCQSEYTYEDGPLLVCPMCSYEWTPGSETVNNEEQGIDQRCKWKCIERWGFCNRN